MSGRQAELEALRLLAQRVPEHQAIVELGAFQGAATVVLAQGSQLGGGARVWAIDLWGIASSGQGRIYDDPRNFDACREALLDTHLDSVVTMARIHSAEAAKLWSRPIGLLFIDADHTYEGCLCDYQEWSKWIAPGGWLAVHDVQNPAWPGVQRVVDEVIRPDARWTDEQFYAPFLSTFRRRMGEA